MIQLLDRDPRCGYRKRYCPQGRGDGSGPIPPKRMIQRILRGPGIVPNCAGHEKRIRSRRQRRQSRWSCFPGGVVSARIRRKPVIPRWTINQPRSQSSSRYFPRRATERTCRPGRSVTSSSGTGSRSFGARIITRANCLPSISRSSRRRVTSTSGSWQRFPQDSHASASIMCGRCHEPHLRDLPMTASSPSNCEIICPMRNLVADADEAYEFPGLRQV